MLVDPDCRVHYKLNAPQPPGLGTTAGRLKNLENNTYASKLDLHEIYNKSKDLDRAPHDLT